MKRDRCVVGEKMNVITDMNSVPLSKLRTSVY